MKRSAILAGITLLLSTAVVLSQEALEDPIPKPIREGGVHVVLTPMTDGLTAPNLGVPPPNHPTHLWVVDQVGLVWALELASGDRTAVLDVSDRLVALGAFGPGTFDERGLLGLAFHPEFAMNGLLYTYTSEPAALAPDFSTMPPATAPNHQAVVAEWQSTDPGNPAAPVDPASRRELLRIDEPQFNHNAGSLVFGPDGMLYIALGDGGAADDQGVGHAPDGNAQTPSNILGSILRIDPEGSNAANGQYGIPGDNPFAGDPDVLDEIFAFGFRNPFRISFDRTTGRLFAADVGQNDIEEIDIVVAGGNYGWRVKEGSFLFDPNGAAPGFVTARADVAGLVDPIAEYDHDEGIAVVGGFVYRGAAIPQLRGRYVFGDFNAPGRMGRLFYLLPGGGIREFRLPGRDGLGLQLLGFGEDGAGELYVLASETGVPFGDTGIVLRIDPFRE